MLLKRSLGSLVPAPERSFLLLTLETGKQRTTSELFFTEYKRCEIARAAVRVDVAASGDGHGFSVTLGTDHPAFFVTLDAEGIAGEFDDNCFTLVPGVPRVVGFSPKGRATLSGFTKALKVRHLRETYA